VVVEHRFEVPLDHTREDGRELEVFARELADPDGRGRPLLVLLTGGPGFEAPRPTAVPRSPSWLDRALRDFRVLMLDQRGTGRSTPVGALSGRNPAEQAEYLTHFRADAIVRDAELIRRRLGVERWSVLGQSFGGFCVTTYLSLAPEGLTPAGRRDRRPPRRRRHDPSDPPPRRRAAHRPGRQHRARHTSRPRRHLGHSARARQTPRPAGQALA
jgi:pimeloyl-ACP methyl ester carboxylesterase